MAFEIFLGIAQTTPGKPLHAPTLPAAAVYREGSTWVLESDLTLPSLTRDVVQSLVQDLKPQHSLTDTILLVDGVLGLPKEVFPKNKNLFELMQRAHRFSHNGKNLNAKTAQAFFAQFIERKPALLPLRDVERLSGSPSVFQSSITSFRLWSDLGSSNEKWFSLWPMDAPEYSGPWIFEAHAPLLWRKVIRSKEMDPETLRLFLLQQKLVKLHPSVLKSLDRKEFRDAVVLAYAAVSIHKKKKLFLSPKSSKGTPLKKEGWIIGI